MTTATRSILHSIAVLSAALCLNCAADAFAQSGPQPSLRIDLTQTYQLSTWQGENTPIFYSTARANSSSFRAITVIPRRTALASDDQGKTWYNWDAFSTWPTMAYADVVRQGSQLLAFGFDSNNAYTGPFFGDRATRA